MEGELTGICDAGTERRGVDKIPVFWYHIYSTAGEIGRRKIE